MGSEIFSVEIPHNGAEKITEDGAGVEWVYIITVQKSLPPNNLSTKHTSITFIKPVVAQIVLFILLKLIK